MDLIERQLRYIFKQQKKSFKLNLSFSFILRDSETGNFRYYYASNNQRYLESPVLISDTQSLNRLIERLRNEDVLEWCMHQRASTKWLVYRLTNVVYYINKLSFSIGGVPELPPHIVSHKFIISLVRNPKTGSPYSDNLCFFRCLALAKNHKYNLASFETTVKEYLRVYLDHIGLSKQAFVGVPISDLDLAARLFKINIIVLTLEENDTTEIFARSSTNFEDNMYLNLWEGHFSYITNFKRYAKTLRCCHCDKIWSNDKNYLRHVKRCSISPLGKPRYVFPGGACKLRPNVFEEMETLEITIDQQHKFYPYFAVWDIECYLSKLSESDVSSNSKINNTEKTTWSQQHVLASIAIHSNIPEFPEPVCFISDGDEVKLVKRMIDHLHLLSETAGRYLREQLQYVYDQLDDLENSEEHAPKARELREKLDAYVDELIVLGFNSSRYDLPIVRQNIFVQLIKEEGISYIIKKSAFNYTCIKTPRLKFLDITNYLAPGYSYAQFLRAYEAPVQKAHFPYTYFDSLDKLNETHLPPHAAFYNNLKHSNITEEEYADCQRVWGEKNMQTFRDFLRYYNLVDVGPFVYCVERMLEYYKEKNLDACKDGVSVPGLVYKLLMSNLANDTFFSLFHQKDQDIYEKLRDCITGGPSIVFKRLAIANETKIRVDGQKVCRSIQGYDSNALYLYCLSSELPTGAYTRRRKSTGFVRERSHFDTIATEYLEWIIHSENLPIKHGLNHGEVVIADRFKADGISIANQLIFEFHGCETHSHESPRCRRRGERNIFSNKPHAQVQQETRERTQALRDLGYEVREIYECEWKEMKSQNPRVKEFLKGYRRGHIQSYSVTKEKIIECVLSGELFGFLVCDLSVPLLVHILLVLFESWSF